MHLGPLYGWTLQALVCSLELPTLGGLTVGKCSLSSVLNLKPYNINKPSVTKQLGNGSFFRNAVWLLEKHQQ